MSALGADAPRERRGRFVARGREGALERLGRTSAQVTLRWHLQRGDIVFPKSVTRSRVEENFDLFDFDLTESDLADFTALNRDERTGPDPDRFHPAF